VLVADFYLRPQWGGWHFARNPIYVRDFTGGFLQSLVFADYQENAILIVPGPL